MELVMESVVSVMVEPMVAKTAATALAKVRDIIIESTMESEEVRGRVEGIVEELTSLQELTEELEGSKLERSVVEDHVSKVEYVNLAARDAIESFFNKRRRKGVLYWLDKYNLGKQLKEITDSIREIKTGILACNTDVHVGVQVSGGGSTILAPALEKLDYILTQNLIILDVQVVKIVERVRDDVFGYLKNLLSNLTPMGERDKVWLEEVKELCDNTVALAEKFIAKIQKMSREGRLWRFWRLLSLIMRDAVLLRNLVFEQENEFVNQMEDICTVFGDALYRRWTFGKDKVPKMGSRSEPATFTPTTPLITEYMFAPLTLFFKIHAYIYETLRHVFLWRHLDQNLKTTQRYLTTIRAFVSDIENAEGLILNERQKVWVKQLRVVALKGQSLVDAAEYPEPEGRGFLSSLQRIQSRMRFAQEILDLLNEIMDISDRKNTYAIPNIQGRKRQQWIRFRGSASEITVRVDPHAPAPPDSFSHRHMTELERELQLITDEKDLMDALLRDAQKIGDEHLNGRSKIWLKQKRDIAPELESLIHECASASASANELEATPMLINILRPSALRLMNKIRRMRTRIKHASGSGEDYGLVERQLQDESLSTIQMLRPRIEPFKTVVGLTEDAEVLLGQLLSDEEGCCITSIVGIKGAGKKTLARLIFDNVKDHFSCRVFVSVSPSWTVEKLRDEIATQIKIKEGQQDPGDSLRTLATTRYLIVVVDIQFETHHFLDTLTQAITDRSTGRRILLTTNNIKTVAAVTGRSFVYPLKFLDDENSWILFINNLSVDVPLPPALIEVGKKIVEKCGGLPSEILKMSNLLSHRDVTEEVWSMQLDPGPNPWSETLTNLPLYLKRCLFYLELFPANFGIPVRRLVILWVAEGLASHGNHQEPPEQVAERYLTGLIHLNMVQVAKRKSNGKVKTCSLSNALRDLIAIKANEIRSRQVHTNTDLNPTNSQLRQVADRFKEEDIWWHNHIHVNTRNDSASLRTSYKDVLSFMSFDYREGSKPGQDIGKFLNQCISSNCLLQLRVLDLEGVYKPELPKNIARLTLLRYLGLRWTYLQSLPSSVGSLLKLQTLDLKYTYIHNLTRSIWKMELRHLFLSETYRTRFPSKLKSAGDSLSDLQTLWGLFVDEETQVKGGLDKLVNIKKLGIACQSMSPDGNGMKSQLDAVADWIVRLEHLKSLRLKSRDEQGQPWNLPLKSLENHIELTNLNLLGRLSDPSILSRFPPNLGELTLSHSKLKDDPMQILKNLENLHSLSLLAESYLGTGFCCDSQSFPKLHVLKVWKLKLLNEWKIKEEALPSLTQLEIRACPRITRLPDGLEHVTTLRELKLTNMPTIEINVGKLQRSCAVQIDD
ncbi:hypothetical protein Fmac_024029 [Flemingia macrophylla]|uniref:Uncharacterized protein n=1 Tax=Flemingia macrophylla TaxID=520843 RepID=A0ABD1LN72_9FABA